MKYALSILFSLISTSVLATPLQITLTQTFKPCTLSVSPFTGQGVDISDKQIDYSINKYGDKGQFLRIDDFNVKDYKDYFEKITIIGLFEFITDDQIIELLDAMPINAAHAKDAESAKCWQFAFQLMATYGLRPIEIQHLSVRSDDGDYVRCDYVKRTGAGYTKPRRLEAFHLEWEKDWQLIERLKAGEALPKTSKSVGTAAMEYLRRKSFFKDLYDQGACTKSFRHSYSKRCHQQYGLIAEEVAKFMGHSVDVHMSEYSDWVTESNRRRTIEFARQRRAEFANTPKAVS